MLLYNYHSLIIFSNNEQVIFRECCVKSKIKFESANIFLEYIHIKSEYINQIIVF